MARTRLFSFLCVLVEGAGLALPGVWGASPIHNFDILHSPRPPFGSLTARGWRGYG
ncbi:MAG: hypothetical protein JWM69_394 [Candidatus Binatus sp.]|nr:hypothetical protein [Candidatus Binatus sp.]